MRIVLFAFAMLAAVALPARADIAPPYPEFHAGIVIDEAEPFPKITTVAAGSPAAKAGVKMGDQVLALNGSFSKPNAPFYFWLKGLRGPKNSTMQLITLRDGMVTVHTLKRTLSVR